MTFLAPDPADGPAQIYDRLVRDCEEFAHLKDGEPIVRWMFTLEEVVRNERRILGTCYQPTVQGQLRPFFEWLMEHYFGELPDFLVILDHQWWSQADDRRREILVHHETSHMTQKKDAFGAPRFHRETGVPVWGIVGHSVEEFNTTVGRYGAYSPDLQEFQAAMAAGDAVAELGRKHGLHA